jgi:N-acetylglucosaminyldiphosphoundecaprenol N-acetyl-beta-D-mannosaminyltransferase
MPPASDLSSGPSSTVRPPDGPPRTPGTAEVLGIPLALVDYESTLDWIDEMADADGRGYICVANVHTVMEAQDDPVLRAAVLESDMTVPDGQPLVWAMNKLGHHLDGRVYGPTLMWKWCERAARTGRRAYLYGGKNQGALIQLAQNLRRDHPGLRIVGGYAPPFRPLDDEEQDAIAREINASGADVVWVGIGVPKQEKWMAEMRDRLTPPVLVGVGAAFDFHAGLQPQAPQVVQELGLEWAYRLGHEPRRLWKRYARYNPRFVTGFARQLGAHRRAR